MRSTTLAAVATELGLGDELRLGKGEAQSGGRSKQSLLADALEALIGAVYLDGGLDPTRQMILRLLDTRIAALPNAEDLVSDPAVHDFKSRLQELVARHLNATLTYQSEESGPEHAKQFSAAVEIDGIVRGTGTGRSKKQAEQAAAEVAFQTLTAELLLDDVPELVPGAACADQVHADSTVAS